MIPIARPAMDQREADAAARTILSGWITQGPRVLEFEQAFAGLVGAEHAVAVSSCTTALHLSLLVAGIKPGDEVVCPSLSFIATANAIMHAGATPVFADVHRRSLNSSVEDIDRAVTPNTKAVLIVHQLGMPAPLDDIATYCRDRGLVLIEDAACALGSRYREQMIGGSGRLCCFSFHPRKVLSTGDGGMISTDDADAADRLRRLRQHGMSVNDLQRHRSKKPVFETYDELGYNYRLTDIQAAIGLEQLKKLDTIVADRRRIASQYCAQLEDLDAVELPCEPVGCESNFQSFSLYLRPTCPVSRDGFMEAMTNAGIVTRPGVMVCHRERFYRQMYPGLSLPVSEDIRDRSVLIPCFSGMTDDEVAKVIGAVRAALS